MAVCCSSSEQLKPQGSCKALTLAVVLGQNSYWAKSLGRQCSSFFTEVTGAHVLPWPTTQETSISYPHWQQVSTCEEPHNHSRSLLQGYPNQKPSHVGLCVGAECIPLLPDCGLPARMGS